MASIGRRYTPSNWYDDMMIWWYDDGKAADILSPITKINQDNLHSVIQFSMHGSAKSCWTSKILQFYDAWSRSLTGFTWVVHSSHAKQCQKIGSHSVYCKGKRHTYPIAEAPVGHNILSRRVAYVQLNAQLAPVIIVLTSVYSQKDILWGEKYDFG